MRAAVVQRPGLLEIKEVPEPELCADEILLRVRAASICNATDNHILWGEFSGSHDRYPQILGHEVCGEVVAKGDDVDHVAVGERLVSYTPHGAFCDYTKISARSAFARVPAAVSDAVACLGEMFHGSLIGTVAPSGAVAGETVVIIGAGPLGLVTLQGLKAFADVRVGVIDRLSTRLDLATRLGADLVWNNSTLSVRDAIAEVLASLSDAPDLVCVCTAADLSADQGLYDFAVQLARPGGRVTGLNVEMKGLSHRVQVLDLFWRRILMARHLRPEVLDERGGMAEHEIFQWGLDLVAAGEVDLGALITHRIGLEDVAEGLRLCRDEPASTLKVVVDLER